MADSGIPDRFSTAIRVGVFWISLPFIFLLIGFERIDEHPYQALLWLVAAIISIIISFYWDKLIPQWARSKSKQLAYLHDEDTELGCAIRDMARCSAWAKWFASQSLATDNHRPASDEYVMGTAAYLVVDALMNGQLDSSGRKPGQLDYEPIHRTHWRSSGIHMIRDDRTLWKMILIPRGGAEIHPDGKVVGSDQKSVQRTEQLATYDSLIVNSRQFEKLWPLKDKETDAARKTLLKKAKKAGADPAEIAKLLSFIYLFLLAGSPDDNFDSFAIFAARRLRFFGELYA